MVLSLRTGENVELLWHGISGRERYNWRHLALIHAPPTRQQAQAAVRTVVAKGADFCGPARFRDRSVELSDRHLKATVVVPRKTYLRLKDLQSIPQVKDLP